MTAKPNHSPRHLVRVGDQHRDEAADRLSAHAAAGRLSVDVGALLRRARRSARRLPLALERST